MQGLQWKGLALLSTAVLILGACAPIGTPAAPLVPGLAQTLAAQTLVAIDAERTLFTTPEPPQIDKAAIVLFDNQMTETPNQADDSPAANAGVVTLEPQESAAATPECTNVAEFVKDVTISDYANLTSNQKFVKTWLFRNAGTCIWTTDYSIVFMWGEAMGCPERLPLHSVVPPGETIEISVPLVAPKQSNNYQGNWLFEDSLGRRFGTGYKGRQFFWVAITVGGGGGGRFDTFGDLCSKGG